MKIIERAKRLIGRGRPKLSEHTIDHSRIDEAVLRDLRKRAPMLEQAIENVPSPEGVEVDPKAWERLAEDVFFSYFEQDEPTVRGRDEIDPRYFVNRAIADKHVRDATFQEERPRTRTKPVPSALGTLGALDSLRKSFENELKDAAEKQQEIGEAQDELDHLNEMMESIRACVQEPDDPQSHEDNIQRMRELGQAKREATANLNAAVQEQALAAADIGRAAGMAVKKAVAAAEGALEAAEMLSGPGLGKAAGPGATVSVERMFELAQRVKGSPELRNVLDMMGRLELSMGSTRREHRRGGFEDIVDIEAGDDLQQILPQEKMLLMHDVGRLDFFRRYQERSLMQYETIEQRELKRGPVIFVNDGSLSMRGAKNVFARGLTLASVSIAHREKRNAAAIEFSGTGQARETVFPKDRPLDPTAMVAFAEQFYGGGTSTLTGMRMAKAMIDGEAPFHSADVVIVTDGIDRVTDEDLAIRDELRAMGVKLHGIAIGIQPTDYLLTICDRSTAVFEYSSKSPGADRLAIVLS